MDRLIDLRKQCGCVVGLASIVLLEGSAFAQAPAAQPAPDTPAASPPAAAAPATPTPEPTPAATTPPPTPAAPPTDAAAAQAPAPAADSQASEPFAFGDFTWLNGANRQHKALLDSDVFTGSFLLDVNYTSSMNRPIDNTVVGSTALSRNNEVTLAFVGFGGDFHYKHARARLMTQFGIRSELVPRNDFSAFRGQFDLADSLRYISEANGGYHWDALHGINLDVGIFMSYVGLFSYDNFENWMYLPSFTSDNTPWFFNGMRIQVFPTDKLKIEPWIINGWQTYGKFNELPGFGAQILWRPNEYLTFLSNDYVGWDTQDAPGRFRFHSDNSAEFLYYKNPKGSFITKVAQSVTVDIGGETGDGVTPFSGQHTSNPANCTTANPCEQDFLSWMTYVRSWFGEEWAFTAGGGQMHNPGRYLVLAPTGIASPIPQPLSIQGVGYGAVSPEAFVIAPGTTFDAWDYEFGFQYMPIEQLTFDIEWNHRQSSVPFFAGHGGVTSPDGYITTGVPGGWRPDLVTKDDRIILALLTRF
jgi:hypothetical protein